MLIPPGLSASLATLVHGWIIDPPPGLIDRTVSGVMPWQAAFETLRAVISAGINRWLVGNPHLPRVKRPVLLIGYSPIEGGEHGQPL
jgi:hypothetical protein